MDFDLNNGQAGAGLSRNSLATDVPRESEPTRSRLPQPTDVIPVTLEAWTILIRGIADLRARIEKLEARTTSDARSKAFDVVVD
jgi:hypothetical protein